MLACHDQTKHIDIRHFFIRDEVKNKTIKLKWVSTQQQLADILTKPLSGEVFCRLRDKLMKEIGGGQNQE